MGYQLAKDPLTGQLLLIPTDGSMPSHPPPHPPAGWPPSPYNALLGSPFGGHHHPHHQAGGPMGLPPPPAAAAAPTATGPGATRDYHHMYLQHQQHLQYLQAAAASRDILHASAAAAAAAAANAPPPLPPVSTSSLLTITSPSISASKKEPPETITVSDDDSDSCLKPSDIKRRRTSSASSPARVARNDVTPAHIPSQQRPERPSCPGPSAAAAATLPAVTKQEVPEPSRGQIKSSPPSSSLSSSSSERAKVKAEPLNLSSEEDPTAASAKDREETPQALLPVKSEPSEGRHKEDVSECVDALMTLSNSVVEEPCSNSGLDLLLQGVELKEQEEASRPTAVDLLCSATQSDVIGFGLHRKYLNVNLLCSVTQTDYEWQRNYVDPMVLLRRRYNLHACRSAEREAAVKEFVAAR